MGGSVDDASVSTCSGFILCWSTFWWSGREVKEVEEEEEEETKEVVEEEEERVEKDWKGDEESELEGNTTGCETGTKLEGLKVKEEKQFEVEGSYLLLISWYFLILSSLFEI